MKNVGSCADTRCNPGGCMEEIAARLFEIPGVEAVTLGGSRATSRGRPDSDWDFGLYYRGGIDPADVRALGWPGEISGPGGWGPVVNGGAWLTVDGQKVDLCYRDLDEVLEIVAEGEAGRFRIEALPTFVAGIPTYVLAGELALCKVLRGSLPRPHFPEALAASAPPRWRQLARMSLVTAVAHASRGDVTATSATLGQAVLAESQARLAERRQWSLNEKGLIVRAGLEATGAILADLWPTPARLAEAVDSVAQELQLRGSRSAPEPVQQEHPWITTADVVCILEALDQAGVRVWVDGGWGVDALVGSETRPHEDLDLVVDASDRGRAEGTLAALGYTHDPLASPGLPARFVLRDERSMQVDLHPVIFDADGNAWQTLGNGGWGLYPADGLDAVGSIGDRQVRCLNAALQVRHHLGYGPRPADRHDLRLLAQHFGVSLPPAL